ncbi:4Fe-4S binding protein [Bacteroidota bacterium]
MNGKFKFLWITGETLTDVFIIILCILVSIIIAESNNNDPQKRHIHVENFRYGKNPSVINCNLGDTLCFTFSSKDTGHSFYLEEFDIDVKVQPSDNKVLQFRVSNPEEPPIITDTVVIIAEHPGWMKYLVSKSTYRCHVWCGPMHAFESGNLIIAPNRLLYLGFGFLFGLFLVGIKKIYIRQVSEDISPIYHEPDRGKDILSKAKWLKKIIRKGWFQPVLMIFGAFFLYIVLLTTFFGTQMSGRNLGVMLIWSVWLFLLVTILTPLGGRIWCLMCPLPMLGDFFQRRAVTRVRFLKKNNNYRNKFFGLQLDWPKRLSNGWMRLFVFMIAGTLSTTLVAMPRATGFAILIIVITATLLALIFKLRSFCSYICPINAFIGTYSQLGKLTLRKADSAVCNNCKGDFCEKGSHFGWACPYDLNVKNIESNIDCGMCTECIRSCSHDNVTFKWRKFAEEIETKDASSGWSAIVMFVFGITYSILYLGPWPIVRDYVNILDKSNWDLFAVYTLLLWSTSLIVFPAVIMFFVKISKYLSGIKERTIDLFVAVTSAFNPLGLFIWIAFIIQMLFVNISFVGQSLSDPFGWGWNLLGLAGTPWIQFVPRWIPWLQVIAVLTGFTYSFRNLRRLYEKRTDKKNVLRGTLPVAALFFLITAVLIQFYAN